MKRISIALLLCILSSAVEIQGQISIQPPRIDFFDPHSIGFNDFILFATAFNARRGNDHFNPIADLNDDGIVDFRDFMIFLQMFSPMIYPIVPLADLISENGVQIEETPNPDDETLQTRIVIPFSHPIRLIRATRPWISTPVIDLETGEETRRAPPIAQTALDTTRQKLTLLVDGIISAGSTFELQRWDIGLLNAYQTLAGSVALPATRSPAEATLARRPFAPADVNLFTQGAYPSASLTVPATGDTLSETAARAALSDFLSRRGIPDLQNALDAFDNPLLIQKMPNPALRAGLVSLTGTLGQPAIDALTRGPLGPIAFGPVSTGDYVQVSENGTVAIDQRYQSEAFPLFGPIFTRLSLQLDAQTGRAEEIATSALLAIVAMQQALADSTLAQSGTELARRLNTQMLARLNSGRAAFPNIGIDQIPGGEIFPGGQSVISYAAVFAPLPDIATPASNLLRTYLTRLAPPGADIPQAQTFNADVLAFLDRHQAILSPDDLIRIARILNLK